MLRRETFHSLRLLMLSHDRAALAPEKARRALVFSYGTKKLQKMSATVQEEAYQAFLKHHLSDELVPSGNWYMDHGFDSASEDGLMLSYLPGKGMLVRLEASLTVEPLQGYIGIISSMASTSSVEREAAHMEALCAHGWPFSPRSSWQSCRDQLPKIMESWIIGKEWSDGLRARRSAWGLVDGLYYELSFYEQTLVGVSITDAELVREYELQGRTQEEDEPSSTSRAEKADLTTLAGIMDYLYDSVHPGVEDSFPPVITQASETQHLPIDDRPEWQRSLTPGEELELQSIFLNADMEILPKLMEQMQSVSSLEEFSNLRNELQNKPENRAQIAANRQMLAQSMSGSSAKRPDERHIKKVVIQTLKSHFNMKHDHRLLGSESLQEDLRANEDDLHLIRTALNVELNINFRTSQWQGVETVSDLTAKALHVCQFPDDGPREDLPPSALDRLRQLNAQTVSSLTDVFEEVAKSIQANFQAQLESFEFAKP